MVLLRHCFPILSTTIKTLHLFLQFFISSSLPSFPSSPASITRNKCSSWGNPSPPITKKKKKKKIQPDSFDHATKLPSFPSPMSSSSASSEPSPFLRGLSNLGLGYALAIALGLLVLLSTLLLASYVCCRTSSRRRRSLSSDPDPLGSVVLPRIIFVAEDDEEEGRANSTVLSAAAGLDPIAIASYPKFQFSTAAEKAKGEGDGICAICLCEYREAEMLRMMPDCGHSFHLICIDAWLRLNASCPVCRNSPMPTPQSTPLSTPLSELVPLSQFAGDRRRRR